MSRRQERQKYPDDPACPVKSRRAIYLGLILSNYFGHFISSEAISLLKKYKILDQSFDFS
jgi:hypothetical protein